MKNWKLKRIFAFSWIVITPNVHLLDAEMRLISDMPIHIALYTGQRPDGELFQTLPEISLNFYLPSVMVKNMVKFPRSDLLWYVKYQITSRGGKNTENILGIFIHLSYLCF